MTAPQQTGPDVEVRAYAREVRAALADVPADRLAELLDDLEEHLVEVAAEGGEPLVVRLGPAAEYAAELRSAAGLAEPAAAPAAPAGTRATWRGELRAGLRRVQASPSYGAVQQFLPELRPAWWVLRAWAALVAVDALFTGSSSFPLPTFGVGPLVGLVLTGLAVTWSVRRGLRVRQDPSLGHPKVAVAANGVLAVLALVAVFGAGGSPEPAMAWYDQAPSTAELAHEDGTPITNIHPYSSDGEPLEDVLLYDQDGRPIDNVAGYTADGEEVQRLDAVPPAPANAFPQQQRVFGYDESGNPVWTTPGAGSPDGGVLPAPEPLPTPETLPGPAPDPFPAPPVEPVP
jgi:hypothetical protein